MSDWTFRFENRHHFKKNFICETVGILKCVFGRWFSHLFWALQYMQPRHSFIETIILRNANDRILFGPMVAHLIRVKGHYKHTHTPPYPAVPSRGQNMRSASNRYDAKSKRFLVYSLRCGFKAIFSRSFFISIQFCCSFFFLRFFSLSFFGWHFCISLHVSSSMRLLPPFLPALVDLLYVQTVYEITFCVWDMRAGHEIMCIQLW